MISEGDSCAPPRDSGLRVNVHRDQGKRVFPRADGWKDVLEKVLEQEGCRWRKFERLVECEDAGRELYILVGVHGWMVLRLGVRLDRGGAWDLPL